MVETALGKNHGATRMGNGKIARDGNGVVGASCGCLACICVLEHCRVTVVPVSKYSAWIASLEPAVLRAFDCVIVTGSYPMIDGEIQRPVSRSALSRKCNRFKFALKWCDGNRWSFNALELD